MLGASRGLMVQLQTSILQDFSVTLVLALLNHYKAAPLPRIEIVDPYSRLVLDDLVLVAEDFVPGAVSLNTSVNLKMLKGQARTVQSGMRLELLNNLN
jgi:hypothetical protein